MKNVPIDYIEAKHLTPDLRKKINGGEQTINNYTTNVSNTYINGVVKAKCISINNISLTDTTTIIDDYTLLTNDIILVAGQTDKLENGLYRYDTNFVRYDFEAGDLIAILNGTDYANSLWKNTNNEIVIGTTGIEFEQINVINYLSDVNIDTPANNEVLTYKDGEWVNLEVDGLPAGTSGEMLINESGEWLPKGNLAITAGGTTTFDYDMKSYGTLDTRFIRFRVKDGDGAYIYLNTTSGTGPRVTLSAESNDTKLELLFNSNNITTLNTFAGSIITATRAGTVRFGVTSTGVILSNSLTASTLLQANASKGIVSIANNAGYLKNDGAGAFTYSSPNLIKYNTALISDTLGVWTNIPTLTFSLEANVTYELELYLSLGNNAGRNGSIRIDTTSAAYIHRPFIIGNSNGANPAVIYINDSTATQPFNLDNSTELQVQNADTGSVVMLKGIITSSINIPSATIQIKTRDVGLAFQCKEYSYLKLSR